MPVKPATLGHRPRSERRRSNDAERRRAHPWRAWYATATWRAIRAAQLAAQPLCERHLKRDQVVPATVCNHVEPHRGDWALFVGGPFESLCKACHDSEVQREEREAARRAVHDGGTEPERG